MSENTDFSWLADRIGRAEYAQFGPVEAPAAAAETSGGHEERAAFADLVGTAGAGVVCEPTQVAHAKRASGNQSAASGPVIALIGWPTGRHHSLIKAAEARLAVEDGADEVWVAVDAVALAGGESGSSASAGGGINAVLADIIAVRQVIEVPTRFGIACPASAGKEALQVLADAVGKVGVDVVAVDVDRRGAWELPSVTCELAVHGAVESLDAAADLLLAGADRVFPAR